MHRYHLQLFSIVLSGVLISIPLVAQQSNQPTVIQGLSAESVLMSAAAASMANASISDVTLSGSARRIAGADDETGTVTFEALSNGAARFDFTYPSGVTNETQTMSEGGPSGVWSGPDGIRHAISPHNLNHSEMVFPAFTLANFASGKNLLFGYVGQEIKNGHSVYHLWIEQQFPGSPASAAVLAQHLTHTDIFIDISSFLVIALDFNMHPDDDASIDIPAELCFSDYHTVSGAPIPFHVEKFLNNGLVLDLEFKNASLNTGISPAAFGIQ